MPQLELLPHSISAMYADSAQNHVLTEADRYGLLAAILTDDIEVEERYAIDRILYFVSRGQFAIV